MTSSSSPARVDVPARQARAVALTTGDLMRVIDTSGGQVGDMFAFVAGHPSEHLSAAHTRAQVGRLFPAPGEQFVTDRRRAVLTLIEDDSPGRHDMLIPACDPARYWALGVWGWHASCAENLRTALSAAGSDAGVDIGATPQPVNLFMDIPVSGSGDLAWKPAATTAGDSVTFRAELDCLVVLSACPQDLVEINGGVPKPLGIEIVPATTR